MNILIFYSTIGNGHWTATAALAHAFSQFYPDIQVKTADIFPPRLKSIGSRETLSFLSSSIFPKLYTRAWKRGSMEWLYHASYRFAGIDRFVLKTAAHNKPDIIVCTQSVPCSIISKSKALFPNTSLVAIPTDYSIHPYWPHQYVDLMLLPSGNSYSPDKYSIVNKLVSGIPVDPKYTTIKPTQFTRYKKISLFVGGSQNASYRYTYGQVFNLARQLASKGTQKQFTFIFGKNKDLKEKVSIILDKQPNVKIIGYLDEVSQQIASSDLIVTKPGGLMLAESLALGRPLALLGQSSGQENANFEFIIRTGCGVELPRNRELEFLENLSDAQIFEMGRSAQETGCPNSSEKAVRAIVAMGAK